MRKIVSLLMVLVCFTFALSAKTIYLNTGGSDLWNQADAKFAVWHWQGANQGSWSAWMTHVNGDIYSTTISDNSDKVIFVRFANTASSPDWNGIWNQTDDLTPGTNDYYTITGWDGSDGFWGTYGSSTGGGGTQPVTPSDYSTAVPSQSEDIMLQGFYWRSYESNAAYGSTTWSNLSGQVNEIARSFTMIWLPPSAAATTFNNAMGYIPNDYSSQASAWGKTNALKSLISAFHNSGVRVIADIVINHGGNSTNACDFKTMNFGTYGTFSPQPSWTTSDDEGHCGGGGADDGQNGNDKNYGAARDWDHTNSQVQNMFKAYLKWMKSEIGYDGWRYDYAGGFHLKHINDYNNASKPYFSVGEYWYGDANTLKSRVDDASKNTLLFDFANYYTAFRDGVGAGNYSKLLNPGLRGKGYSKYAVLFVDNHDTFNRYASDYQVTDFLGRGDGSSINDASKILQANAYMLAMPGVPCVFYPHWVRYKAEIQKMITARRAAGVHSESQVNETAGNGYYEATVTGKRGNLILYLGSSATKAAPAGYTKACSGNGYALYYTGVLSAIEETTLNPHSGTKYIRNGQLIIERGGKSYNVYGQQIQ